MYSNVPAKFKQFTDEEWKKKIEDRIYNLEHAFYRGQSNSAMIMNYYNYCVYQYALEAVNARLAKKGDDSNDNASGEKG